MNDTRNAYERLDALLSALEDEVLRAEGGVTIDSKATRAEIEALIDKHIDVADGGRKAMRKAVDVKDKVVSAVELLGRWGTIGKSRVRPLGPRIRMAFSGSKSEQDEARSKELERGGGCGDQERKKED